MKPYELLDALLGLKGLTPTGLAKAINMPKAQGTISKYIRGGVGVPRGEWVKPAAQYLSIELESLRDEDAATREAKRLGIAAGQPSPAAAPRPTTPRQARIDAGMLALQLADLMRGYPANTRKVVAGLFQNAAEDPDEAPRIADALRALLAGPEKAPAPMAA